MTPCFGRIMLSKPKEVSPKNLGEKIYKLRKERNLSQEALAEFVGTIRQAISKWENNQGYPETEKLLLLSNVFEVSIDFLLKDEKTESSADEKGYYVSREMAVGYIANEKKTCKYFGAGQQRLPVTRQEFENRSMLYHILEDMKAFLDIKKDFITAR